MSDQLAKDCCRTCRHWKPYTDQDYHLGPESYGKRKQPPGIDRGVCLLTERWQGDDCHPASKAVAYDSESHSSVLHTDHDFYCNQFERSDAP